MVLASYVFKLNITLWSSETLKCIWENCNVTNCFKKLKWCNIVLLSAVMHRLYTLLTEWTSSQKRFHFLKCGHFQLFFSCSVFLTPIYTEASEKEPCFIHVNVWFFFFYSFFYLCWTIKQYFFSSWLNTTIKRMQI